MIDKSEGAVSTEAENRQTLVETAGQALKISWLSSSLDQHMSSLLQRLIRVRQMSSLPVQRNAPRSHTAARSKHADYPLRYTVPDDKVSWSSPFPEYRPIEFTSKRILEHKSSAVDAADPLSIHQQVTDHRLDEDVTAAILIHCSFLGDVRRKADKAQNI